MEFFPRCYNVTENKKVFQPCGLNLVHQRFKMMLYDSDVENIETFPQHFLFQIFLVISGGKNLQMKNTSMLFEQNIQTNRTYYVTC